MISGNRGPRSYRKKWLFFFILMAFSVFVIYDHRLELIADFYAGDYQKMLILLVLLFPVFFAFKELTKGNHSRYFGDTPLTIHPHPLILGQNFSGVVQVSRGAKLLNSMQFRATIRLLQTSAAELGDNHNTRVDSLWVESLSVTTEYGAAGVSLSTQGRLPAESKAGSVNIANDKFAVFDGDSQLVWQLSIISTDKKFRQSWDVPVSKAR